MLVRTIFKLFSQMKWINMDQETDLQNSKYCSHNKEKWKEKAMDMLSS